MSVVSVTSNEIQVWSQNHIAQALAIPAQKINPDVEFDRLGLDSTTLMTYLMSLEEWLGVELVPDIFFSYTSIASLSDYLSAQVANKS